MKIEFETFILDLPAGADLQVIKGEKAVYKVFLPEEKGGGEEIVQFSVPLGNNAGRNEVPPKSLADFHGYYVQQSTLIPLDAFSRQRIELVTPPYIVPFGPTWPWGEAGEDDVPGDV